MASYSDPNLSQSELHLLHLDLTDLTPTFLHSPPSPTSPVSSSTPSDPLHFDTFNFEYGTQGAHGGGGAGPSPQTTSPHHQAPHFSPDAHPATFSPISGQNSIQGEHVLYYFEHVRRMQYIFAGNSITNITYSVREIIKTIMGILMLNRTIFVRSTLFRNLRAQ
jgi:hypothetical protein